MDFSNSAEQRENGVQTDTRPNIQKNRPRFDVQHPTSIFDATKPSVHDFGLFIEFAGELQLGNMRVLILSRGEEDGVHDLAQSEFPRCQTILLQLWQLFRKTTILFVKWNLSKFAIHRSLSRCIVFKAGFPTRMAFPASLDAALSSWWDPHCQLAFSQIQRTNFATVRSL